jgi:putative MATE family efflux protein
LILGFGSSLVFGALGIIFSPRLLEAMGGSGEVLELASRYLRLLYAGFPLMSLAMVIDGIFIGLGDTKTPFRLQVGGVFLNAALSAVVLLGLGAGIRGIALASICTRGLVGATGALILAHRLAPGAARAMIARRRALPRPDLRLWGEILRVGLPVAASITFYSGIFMALNRVLSQFGQEAFSVLGIGIRGNEAVGYMVLVGFGAAASTLTGAAMGRESRQATSDLAGHVRGTVLRVLVAAAPVALLFSTLWLIVPEPLCSIYTDDPHLIELSSAYLRLAAFANLFQLLEMVLGEGMTGAGISSYPLMVTVPGNLLRIPLALALVAWTPWGINAVWAAILVSCMIKGLGMLWIFHRADWPGQAALRTRELGRRVAAARA